MQVVPAGHGSFGGFIRPCFRARSRELPTPMGAATCPPARRRTAVRPWLRPHPRGSWGRGRARWMRLGGGGARHRSGASWRRATARGNRSRRWRAATQCTAVCCSGGGVDFANRGTRTRGLFRWLSRRPRRQARARQGGTAFLRQRIAPVRNGGAIVRRAPSCLGERHRRIRSQAEIAATAIDCHTLDPGLRAAGGDIQIQCRAIAVHTRFGERFRGGSGERSHHVPTVFPTFYLGTYGNRTDLSSTKTSIFIGASCDSGNAWDPLK